MHLFLSNVKNIDECFLHECDSLEEIIIENHSNYLRDVISELDINIKIIIKNEHCEFKNFDDDLEKIQNDKKFVKRLLNYLNISFNKKSSHKNLIKKMQYINKKYKNVLTYEELKQCRNHEDLFTGKDIKDICQKRLIFINKIDDTYDCFDIVELKKYLCNYNHNEIYLNPFTKTQINDDDLEKIFTINTECLAYFT